MKKFIMIAVMFVCIFKTNAFTIGDWYDTDYHIIMEIASDSVFQIMEEDSVTISEENGGYYVYNWHMFIPVNGKRYIIKEASIIDLFNKSKIRKQNAKNIKKGLPIKEIYTYKKFIYDEEKYKKIKK